MLRAPKQSIRDTLKCVIVGNGVAGFSAAADLRRLAPQGEIILISAEPFPLYSACVLPNYVSGEISRDRVFIKKEEDYRHLGIQAQWGRVVERIDPMAREVALDGGTRIPYNKLVLATGSESISFGKGPPGVFKLKTLADADAIVNHGGRKAVVVGAGPIGLEIGIALRMRGVRVTILEKLDQVLPLGLDPPGAARVEKILREKGIEIATGEYCEEVLGTDRLEGVATNKRELICDTLVWAVGMRPRSDLARQAGAQIGKKNGIRVNAHLETSLPDIYACGDCVESPDILTGEPYPNLFWHNARRQGIIVARNCAGWSSAYAGSQNLLNIDVFGNHVAGFGFTASNLRPFQDIPAFSGQPMEVTVIEREQRESYFRLVILGDRCLGGQFINPGQGVGLIWSLIQKRQSIRELLKNLEKEEWLRFQPWMKRIKAYWATGQNLRSWSFPLHP
jgi:NADH oxidase (H2O2-forming)